MAEGRQVSNYMTDYNIETQPEKVYQKQPEVMDLHLSGTPAPNEKA
jgi:hypothetical protein